MIGLLYSIEFGAGDAGLEPGAKYTFSFTVEGQGQSFHE
jgi:hypothetical protein